MRRSALGLLVLLSASALGQVKFTTQRFKVDAEIRRDRTAEITETISVDFFEPRRGILREVPFRTATSDGKRVREVSYTLLRVEADRGSGFSTVPVQERREGGDWNLRIGDPDVTVEGRVTYRIAYRAKGALTDFDTNDELGPRTEFTWILIPRGWPTAIKEAEISASFPAPKAGTLAARILVGGRGSRAGVEIRPGEPVVGREDLLTASFTGKTSLAARPKNGLGDDDSLALILALPEGTVEAAPPGTEINRPQEQARSPGGRSAPYEDVTGPTGRGPSDAWRNLTSFNLWGFLIPLLSLPALYWIVKGRMAPKQGPLVVRFDPPDGVGASECGVILDNRVDTRDIVAGIVSLAQKGALRMVHAGAGPESVVLQLLGMQNARGLSRFESTLYMSLEPYGPVIYPDVLRGNFYQQYQGLTAELHDEVVRRGYYSGRADVAGCTPGCVLMAAVGALVFFALPRFGFSALLGGAAAFIGGFILVGKTSNLTPIGAKVLGQVLGLREFITRANQRELNYMAERMPDQALFERLLPYAVAFGAVGQWTKAFEGINLEPPEWFGGVYGNDLLWTVLLIDTMGGFEHTWGDAMAYNPAADVSSFGSGGGFSSGDSGFGGGFDSDSGGFSGGGDVDSGGGGGGGGDW